MKKLFFFFLLCSHVALSQDVNRYMVYFANKEGSSFFINQPQEFLTQRAIDRRQQSKIAITEQDLPVSDQYVAQVRAMGVPVYYRSRWINAVLVEEEADKVKALSNLPFVTEVKYVAPGKKLGARVQSSSQQQLEVPQTQHELLDIQILSCNKEAS